MAQTGRPIFIPNVDQDQRFSARVDTATGYDTRSIIALPLVVRGEVIGVFEVINVEDERFFREKYLPHLSILADYVAIAVDNVRNLQKLQARTYIDEVTGFYNTRFLIYSLDRLIPQIHQQGGEFSVVFLDLDNFKAVVDGYGHLRGSKVLGEVARVFHSLLGPDDSLVRYGGDEFIIVLPHRAQAQTLELTRRLRERLNQTSFLTAEGLNLRLTASYGIATLPADAQDREGLLNVADQALFSSKGRGKDRIMLGRELTPAEEVYLFFASFTHQISVTQASGLRRTGETPAPPKAGSNFLRIHYRAARGRRKYRCWPRVSPVSLLRGRGARRPSSFRRMRLPLPGITWLSPERPRPPWPF